MRQTLPLFVFLSLSGPVRAQADDPAAVRRAVEKSLPLLQQGGKTFRERSEGRCIGCHHQGPLQVTVALARERGFRIDEALERAELERIRGFYARRQELYHKALTDPAARRRADSYGNFNVHVGYWLTGYAAEKGPPDEATATAALLLAAKQSDDGHWDFDDVARAPMQAGDFTTTALAVRVLQLYGPRDRAEAWSGAVSRAKAWFLNNEPRTTDDKVYRLYGLTWTAADPGVRQQALEVLLTGQRDDGGWAQQDNMPSDAYATGLALRALHEAGELATSAPAYRRGVAYLLKTQRPDGSWFVRTHAIPSNPYFESGFPHGKSQFISFAGTCYATAALLHSLQQSR